MIDENFSSEIISIYTDDDAVEDGVLIDISGFGIKFNNRIINRITQGAETVLNLLEKQRATAKNNLQFIADRAAQDGEGFDAWGIFEPEARLGNEKLWLVCNELGGYTLMLPADY